MAEWITLQETADKVGIRKGTLCMWRNRNKFPFKTKGKGRSLQVNVESIEKWMKEDKGKAVKPAAKKAKKKVAKKRGPKVKVAAKTTVVEAKPAKPGRKKGKKRGRKPGRPAKAATKRAYTRKVAGGACTIMVSGDLDLESLQQFVADIKAGSNVHVTPSKSGYVLTAVSS